MAMSGMTVSNLPPNVVLAPGEAVVAHERFALSLLLFFLHLDLVTTDRRVAGTSPNTILGVIPLGSNAVSYPMSNIASVGTSTRVQPVLLIIGIIVTLVSLGSFASGGWFGFLIGLVLIAAAIQSVLVITNNAGAAIAHRVSPLDIGRAQEFVRSINTALAGRG